jgi:hypothetical protein
MKPSVEELRSHGLTLSPPFTNILGFFNYYESNGWKVGRSPMKSWKAAMGTWHQRDNPKPKSADDEIARQKARQ